jgi:hypothetical protein
MDNLPIGKDQYRLIGRIRRLRNQRRGVDGRQERLDPGSDIWWIRSRFRGCWDRLRGNVVVQVVRKNRLVILFVSASFRGK